MEGQVRCAGVCLRQLVPPPGATDRLASGLLNGRLDFQGADIKSLDDITAALDGTLQQTEASAFPVLRDLVPYFGPGDGDRTVFDSGDCRARLARGGVRIERLSLVGPTLRLQLDGTVGLGGQLGLNAAIHTGRLGADADPPVSVRLVRLRVDGTVPKPAIQVTP